MFLNNQVSAAVLHFPYACNKAVAPLRNSLDVEVIIRTIAEHFPQSGNMPGKVHLFYKAVGPDPIHQLVFFNYVSAVFCEHEQAIESLRGERHGVSIAQQHTLVKV